MCRASVLPQVGVADRPRRHHRRPQGLPQVWHRCRGQGRRYQGTPQEWERRGRYWRVSQCEGVRGKEEKEEEKELGNEGECEWENVMRGEKAGEEHKRYMCRLIIASYYLLCEEKLSKMSSNRRIHSINPIQRHV